MTPLNDYITRLCIIKPMSTTNFKTIQHFLYSYVNVFLCHIIVLPKRCTHSSKGKLAGFLFLVRTPLKRGVLDITLCDSVCQ
jgi:hypothetical protein